MAVDAMIGSQPSVVNASIPGQPRVMFRLRRVVSAIIIVVLALLGLTLLVDPSGQREAEQEQPRLTSPLHQPEPQDRKARQPESREPVPKNKWDALEFGQIDEEMEKEKAPQFRVWTDRTGQHETTAKFRSLSFEKVKLELKDESIIEVSADALCDADREYIEERKRMALQSR